MGKVNESKYRLVRLRRDTVKALDALIERWSSAWERGEGIVPPSNVTDGISYDAAVQELVRREDAKAARSRKGRRPQKAAGGTKESADATDVLT